MNVVIFIIVGVVVGVLAGKVMRDGGFGLFMNLTLAIIGGLLGAAMLYLFDIKCAGMLGGVIATVIGSILFLWLAKLARGRYDGAR